MGDLNDPKYRAQIEYLYNWLLDGRELARLQKLVAETKAHPRKHSYSRYHVKNADGSIYRRPRKNSP